MTKAVAQAYQYCNEMVGNGGTPIVQSNERVSDEDGLNRSSRNDEEKTEQKNAKIRGFKRRWKIIKEELYNGEKLEERKRAELEALKSSIQELERSYSSLSQDGLSPEQERDLTIVRVGGQDVDMDKIFFSWKKNILEGIEEKIRNERRKEEGRKQAMIDGANISKTINFPPLESQKKILEWIEVVGTVLDSIPTEYPDTLICEKLKKSMVTSRDKKNTLVMVNTSDLMGYIKTEYLTNHNVSLHIMQNIQTCKEPTTFEEARGNIKTVNRNLKMIKKNNLEKFLNQTHLKIMENKTILTDRLHLYFKYCFDQQEKKKVEQLELGEVDRENLIPENESTRNDAVGLELDTINLPGNLAINESRNLMKGLKDDIKFNISAQSIQEKLVTYEKFIKEEDNFLSSMINNRREFKLVQSASGMTRTPTRRKPDWYNSHKIEGEEDGSEDELNTFYSKHTGNGKKFNGKRVQDEKTFGGRQDDNVS